MINPLDYRGKCFLNKPTKNNFCVTKINEVYIEDFALLHSEDIIQYYCIEYDSIEIDENKLLIETGLQKLFRTGDLHHFNKVFREFFGDEIYFASYSNIKKIVSEPLHLANKKVQGLKYLRIKKG